MTVEERYSADDRVGEIHHQIDVPLYWNIDCIQPFWIRETPPVLGISERVNLVDVEWVRPTPAGMLFPVSALIVP
jgi:hypothetical protein